MFGLHLSLLNGIPRSFLFIVIKCFGIVFFALSSCSRAYFPIELKNFSREERLVGQEDHVLTLRSMTESSVKKANLKPFKRYIIQKKGIETQKLVPLLNAFSQKMPPQTDFDDYTIGVGDQITIFRANNQRMLNENDPVFSLRNYIVSNDGVISAHDVGKVEVSGLTKNELRDKLLEKFALLSTATLFEVEISGFNSKKINIIPLSGGLVRIPYPESPIFLKDVVSNIIPKDQVVAAELIKIVLKRGKKKYDMSLAHLVEQDLAIRLMENDTIKIEKLVEKKQTVMIVGETGAQTTKNIDFFTRPTLSETILNAESLNNVTSDFSQLYVLRKEKLKFLAHHLDITLPSRLYLADRFQMRPGDIVFIATQPLSLYSRTLQQILGSTGLTLQARDTIRNELRN